MFQKWASQYCDSIINHFQAKKKLRGKNCELGGNFCLLISFCAMLIFVTTRVFIFIKRLRFPSKVSISTILGLLSLFPSASNLSAMSVRTTRVSMLALFFRIVFAAVLVTLVSNRHNYLSYCVNHLGRAKRLEFRLSCQSPRQGKKKKLLVKPFYTHIRRTRLSCRTGWIFKSCQAAWKASFPWHNQTCLI